MPNDTEPLLEPVTALVREYHVHVYSPDGVLVKSQAFYSLNALIEWAQQEKMNRLVEIEDHI